MVYLNVKLFFAILTASINNETTTFPFFHIRLVNCQ